MTDSQTYPQTSRCLQYCEKASGQHQNTRATSPYSLAYQGREGNLQTSIHLQRTLTFAAFLPVFRCLGHNYCLYLHSEVYELYVSWPKRQRQGNYSISIDLLQRGVLLWRLQGQESILLLGVFQALTIELFLKVFRCRQCIEPTARLDTLSLLSFNPSITTPYILPTPNLQGIEHIAFSYTLKFQVVERRPFVPALGAYQLQLLLLQPPALRHQPKLLLPLVLESSSQPLPVVLLL